MTEPIWPTTSAVATEPAVVPAPGRRPAGPAPAMDKREQQAALVRLIIVVAAGLVVAALSGALETVLVVLGLILMIVLHELGHFVWQRAGMKVTESSSALARGLVNPVCEVPPMGQGVVVRR